MTAAVVAAAALVVAANAGPARAVPPAPSAQVTTADQAPSH
ncbi:hypothetical protein [Streptomyces naphthomycinicus]|nr:hypothetical protein [Streptomyces sp. TML10]